MPGAAILLHPQLDKGAGARDRTADPAASQKGVDGLHRQEIPGDVADRQQAGGPVRRRDDGVAVGQRRRDRLFQQDVLARAQRRDRDLAVHIVRGGDHDDIHGRIAQQRGPVGMGRAAVAGGKGRDRVGVVAADGCQPRARDLAQRLGVNRAEMARADDAGADLGACALPVRPALRHCRPLPCPAYSAANA